jgi:hypothetical protein
MAVSLKHATESTAGPYTPEGELGPAEWNAEHALTIASQRVMGRTTASTGAVEELKGMWVEVSRATASSSASIDFTGIDSSADEWMVRIYNAIPGTDARYLLFRTSSNGGTSYDSGASDYTQLYGKFGTGGGESTESQVYLSWTYTIGNDTNETGMNSTLILTRPSATMYANFEYHSVIVTDDAGSLGGELGFARRTTAAVVNALSFFMDSGNISSGTFVLYKRLK